MGVSHFAWVLPLLLLLPLPAVRGFIILVEHKECLIQPVEEGDVITGSFVVLDVDSAWTEGDAGIDFWVEGPKKYKPYSIKGRSEDHFQIKAISKGNYRLCMENVEHMAATVEINFHIGHESDHVKLQKAAKEEHMEELLFHIENIHNDLVLVQQDQMYFRARDLRRKKTNESTRRRVLWYSVMEALVLVAASLVQVLILRRLFEKKAMKFSPI